MAQMGYQEQLARAKAEKAARMAGNSPAGVAPVRPAPTAAVPQQQYSPPPPPLPAQQAYSQGQVR